MSDRPASGFARRALRPLRRALAWFALVGEERATREWEMRTLGDRVRDSLHSELTSGPPGLGEQMELTVQELWRRSEGADARNATEIQRLAERVERLERRLAEVDGAGPPPGDA